MEGHIRRARVLLVVREGPRLLGVPPQDDPSLQVVEGTHEVVPALENDPPQRRLVQGWFEQAHDGRVGPVGFALAILGGVSPNTDQFPARFEAWLALWSIALTRRGSLPRSRSSGVMLAGLFPSANQSLRLLCRCRPSWIWADPPPGQVSLPLYRQFPVSEHG